MELKGSAELGMTAKDVYDILSDPERIAKLVPGMQSYEKDGDRVKMNVMVGYSFIKGRFTVKIKSINKTEPSHVDVKGSGSGAGTSIDFLSKFDIKDKGAKSEISWDADVNVGGIAATMGGGMIKSAADKFILQIIEALKNGTK
ncbi:MAG: hypothetical protein BK997_02905 [Candidatus Micrarchaeum sp. ARMAN-1]|nr:MAG: hypothetical protein BK997_02905 [Candidatus Micrarchaeum sp. ARMAN-1]